MGLGGGFRYCVLGDPLFGADARISPLVTYLGVARDVAVYLLYDGTSDDRTSEGGTS